MKLPYAAVIGVFSLGIGVLAYAPLAAAKCASHYLGVWPEPGSELHPKQRLILTGYLGSQAFVSRLSANVPELVPEDPGRAGIPLRVVAIYAGEKDLTQAVLEPTERLREGTRYRFSAKGLGDLARGNAWEWRVRSRAMGPPPYWTSGPRSAGSQHIRYGCGPARYAYVDGQLEGDDVWVRASVRPEVATAARTFLLQMKGGRLSIGHGMCSGAFNLHPGVRYEVSLVAVDAFGREMAAPGGPVMVTGPTVGR